MGMIKTQLRTREPCPRCEGRGNVLAPGQERHAAGHLKWVVCGHCAGMAYVEEWVDLTELYDRLEIMRMARED